MDNTLIWQSASTLAQMIRARDVSAVEVTEDYLRRIEAVNPRLNAIVTLDAEHALSAAMRADAARHSGDTLGALHGVPVTLKDCHATAGMRTTAGTLSLADYVPATDGTVATRLRAAGAIILGKTNVSELLADVQSTNPVFGRSSNPWDTARTPGGSSGGAAAAVSAGMCAFDIGSDIGGSIRLPSHCCGVLGLKPTENRVSGFGHIPDLPQHVRTTRIMNSIGPIARTIEDLELGLRVIAGPDIHDVEVPPALLPAVVTPPLETVRIAWAASFPGLPVQGATRSAIEHLASTLTTHGAQVEEALPDIDFEHQLAVRATLRRVVRMLIEVPAGEAPSALHYLTALDQRDQFTRTWEAFFTTYDALICPVMMTTAFPHCERGTPIDIDGTPHPYELLPDYCRPFNLTGHPVVTLPVGIDDGGMPIGVQIVGARWSESRLLGVARAISHCAESTGFRQPPL